MFRISGDGEAMQMKEGVTLLDAGEQVLVIIDLEVRVKAALHEDSRAAQRESFIDLLEDRLERLDVSFGRTHRPVEGAKRAVLRANIGVVDVAVNDVGDHAFRMEPLAHGVSLEADAEQIIGLQHVESLGRS